MNHVRPTTGAGWWLRTAGSWLVLLSVLVVVTATIAVPRLAGGTAYTVLTGSMQPTLPPGTLIVTRPVGAGDLAIGDVITYQLESGRPAVVTHRIISLGYAASGEVTVRTQGDHNTAADPAVVRPVQVRGRLWYAVPYVGYVNTLLTGQRRSLLIGLVAAGLLGYATAMFVSAGRDRRHRRRVLGGPAQVPR